MSYREPLFYTGGDEKTTGGEPFLYLSWGRLTYFRPWRGGGGGGRDFKFVLTAKYRILRLICTNHQLIVCKYVEFISPPPFYFFGGRGVLSVLVMRGATCFCMAMGGLTYFLCH